VNTVELEHAAEWLWIRWSPWTVAEVLPTVKENQEGIKQVLEQLATSRIKKEKEAAEWKVRRGRPCLAERCDVETGPPGPARSGTLLGLVGHEHRAEMSCEL